MEKLSFHLADLRIILRFFPLMRLFFRNLGMLCLLIHTKRMKNSMTKAIDRYLQLQDKNLKDPFLPEFFTLYAALYGKCPEKKTEEIPFSANDNSIESKLSRLMETKPLYTNLDLTIDDISRELATNRTYLSKVIKQSFQSGFRDYLNKFRLEKAKELMCNPHSSGLNLLVISEQVGFRNYGTFNSAFKKEYGITPGEWKLRETQLAHKNC